MRNYYKYFLIISLFSISCKKFVTVDPPVTSPPSSTIYETDATAIAVLNGIYSQLVTSNIAGGSKSITALTALNSDELKNYSVDPLLEQSYSNALRNSSTFDFWGNLYKFIYATNSVIEGLNKSTGVSETVRQQLLGEVKFLRAYLYFYLVNLFGDVPLLLTTDYKANAKAGKTSTSEVYGQIIIDLKEAQGSLNENYIALDGILTTTERVRPNKFSATALLSRAYLYNGEWANAEAEATKVIGSSKYSLVTNLNNVFKKNSSEAIWQLQPVIQQYNTADAIAFILTTAPGANYNFALSDTLVSGFEANDARKTNWVRSLTSAGKTYHYPYKYQVTTAQPASEYVMMLRLAEVYLIRAEARTRQEKISEAQADLNTIRTRALLPTTTAATQTLLITAIEAERQHELFTEMGHRWFDLKRLDRINQVMSTFTPLKGGTWSPDWRFYPIPQNEILLNTNLIQNDGY